MENTLKIILLSICLIVNSLVMGCAGWGIPLEDLKPGMTKEEVSELFHGAKPIGYSRTGPVEVFEYDEFTLFFVNDKLAEWHPRRSNSMSGFFGVTVPIPAPPHSY